MHSSLSSWLAAWDALQLRARVLAADVDALGPLPAPVDGPEVEQLLAFRRSAGLPDHAASHDDQSRAVDPMSVGFLPPRTAAQRIARQATAAAESHLSQAATQVVRAADFGSGVGVVTLRGPHYEQAMAYGLYRLLPATHPLRDLLREPDCFQAHMVLLGPARGTANGPATLAWYLLSNVVQLTALWRRQELAEQAEHAERLRLERERREKDQYTPEGRLVQELQRRVQELEARR